jgi:lipoprotein-releasing system permease protein
VFRPLELFVGLRYTRAKRRNHFISFISLTSMLGIALGVTALITVLSVMNGFERELANASSAWPPTPRQWRGGRLETGAWRRGTVERATPM